MVVAQEPHTLVAVAVVLVQSEPMVLLQVMLAVTAVLEQPT
jgi:hypothetical protein